MERKRTAMRQRQRQREGGDDDSTRGAYIVYVVHVGIAWVLRPPRSAYLPTLNLCQPTITGSMVASFLEPVLARFGDAKFTRLA